MLVRSLFLLSFFLLTSCALPAVSPHSARTLGNGNWQLQGGLFPHNFSLTRGFGENFNLGLTLEATSASVAGLRTQYAFVNNKEKGFSFAGYLEGFRTLESPYQQGGHGGPVLSYKSGAFEPYLVGSYRFVYWGKNGCEKAKRGSTKVDKDNPFKNFFETLIDEVIGDTCKKGSYDYGVATLGLNVWVLRDVGINLFAHYIYLDFLDDPHLVLPGAGLLVRF